MNMVSLLGSFLLAGASPSALAGAPAPNAVQPGDIKAAADALLESAFPADGPGAAVVVTRGGRVIYAAGRGLADLETKRPITPATVFKLGSIAKQFTAATILQLVAEGRVSLDDPISRFFPDYPQPGAGATVRQLLNHTSGIQDYTKIPGWMGREGRQPHTTAELMAVVSGRPAKTKPGTAWEYNNAGYMMLGAIIEKVTGKAWHEAVEERVARRLGLPSIADWLDAQNNPAMVRGYTKSEGDVRPATGGHASVAHAAGGLAGSPLDLAKWAQALHHGKVVSPALYKEMISPARLADGSTQPYGFGLRMRQIRGRDALVHGGAGGGLDTDSVYIPSEDLFVAVFANSDSPASDPSILTRRLAALALGEPFPAFTRTELPMSAIEPLFGAYQSKGGESLTFHSRDGKLYLAVGYDEMEVFAAGQDRFFFGPDRLPWLRFVRQADGTALMELHEPDDKEPERAVRTGAVPPPLVIPPAVLQSYVGTFQTETVELTFALDDKGRLTVRGGDNPASLLRPISTTEFRLDAGRFRLVFHPENGVVDRVTLYRGARELNGRRVAKYAD